ncbi:MAG: HEAT repeat domain-containing protein [Nitrospirae bacterium]|nr:HEAT repeat domain-containing protein [Nitrospirota bacterium]
MLTVRQSAVLRALQTPSGAALLLCTVIAGCEAGSMQPDPASVVPRLAELLEDHDSEVRKTAALSLGKIARAESAAILVEHLNDPDPSVRQTSAWALGNLGEVALDQAGLALASKLDDPSPAVKFAAAHALGLIGSTQVIIELVTERLRYSDVHTRRAAVQALAWLEAASAFPTLIQALSDQDARVRQGAVSALGELADLRALSSFQDLLLKDPDVGVRSEAAYRLGKLGDLTVLPALRSAAAHDRDPGVRRWALWALDQITPESDSDSRL